MSENSENNTKREIKSPPVLMNKTQSVIKKIEDILNAPLITYWNSTDGSVCANDVSALYNILKRRDNFDHLYLFIKSGGGHGGSSLRLVNLLRQYADRITALIPLEAQSAATMLALGADEIHMGPLAHLSAVDTSLKHPLSPLDNVNNRVSVSQDGLSRVVSLWEKHAKNEPSGPYKTLFDHVHPLVIGEVDRASALSTRLCIDILQYHMNDMKKAKEISSTLNSSYPSHTYPITYEEAKRIGLNVSPLNEELNTLLLELNEYYSEMGQTAQTDFDQENYHDSGILNIHEGRDRMMFYQNDTDWHYRSSERRWVRLNDNASWRVATLDGDDVNVSIAHVS